MSDQIEPVDERLEDAEPLQPMDLADRVAMLERSEQDELEAALRAFYTTQRLDENVAAVLERRRTAVGTLARLLERPALGIA